MIRVSRILIFEESYIKQEYDSNHDYIHFIVELMRLSGIENRYVKLKLVKLDGLQEGNNIKFTYGDQFWNVHRKISFIIYISILKYFGY